MELVEMDTSGSGVVQNSLFVLNSFISVVRTVVDVFQCHTPGYPHGCAAS